MKKIMMAAVLLLATGSLYAQKGTVTATLIDRGNDQPVAGAVVEVRSLADTTQTKYFTSVYGGVVNIPGIDYGEYALTFSFLGYKDHKTNVTVDRATVNLGTIRLDENATMIDAVVTQGQAIRTSLRGDTVAYNADAYKVAKDADAEALLSKMPGITVVDGEVEAQGETVQKVYVNGKEFFGQDVSTAIKTLPAEMISSVEVYNKLSDQAEFSGVDDGDSFKAINIVTNVQKAQFGKLYGAYGIKNKYNVGGNVNFFGGNHQFSVLGLVNNVNQQNFSIEDILGAVSSNSSGGMSSRGGGMRGFGSARSFMVPQQDGISQVQSFGANYMGTWAKKIEVTGSYLFNNSNNKYWSESERNYTNQYAWADSIYNQNKTRNQEHRFNARLEYKINENHQLMMRPSFSFQRYRSSYESLTDRWEPDATGDGYDYYYNYVNNSESKNWGFNIGNNLIYRVRLGKAGRTLTTDIGGRYSKNDRDGESYNLTTYSDLSQEIDRELTYNNTKSYSLSGSVMYTEPVSKHGQITAQYRANYSYSDADRKKYTWDEVNSVYYDYYDPDYSSIYNSGYLTQRMGPGFNYRKDKTNFNLSLEYQRSTLTSNEEFPVDQDLKYNFDNIVYFGRIEHSFNSSNTIRVFARSNTSNPSISQLQDVWDISNIQSVTVGNPDLKPSYEHSVMAHYNRSNLQKGRTLMIMGHFSVRDNYIGERTTTSTGSNIELPDGGYLQPGSQLREYRNMSGYWNSRVGFNYGFPVIPLRSNINFNVDATLRGTPSVSDGEKNDLFGQYYNAGVVIGSNISDRVDFTLMYRGGYNVDKYTITENNEYMSHYLSLRFKWVTWQDITFSGNGSYVQNKGITDDYNDRVYTLNLALGKKIFRNRRGEITIGVNDVFDQKTNFRRNVTTNYIENVKYNTLGRYYSLQFIFNLRTYGNSGSAGSDGPDTLRGPGPGGMRMGPPPGGGGPGF
ncbi:MAG: outer membrane beta-barrel protein [Alistipes sp.]|nr:outer membrane beta-barrel protein [Alistipes sp.]